MYFEQPYQQELSLSNAIIMHREGRLEVAQTLYSDLLNLNPANLDVLQLFGMLATQTNQNQLAVELAQRAVKISPEDASLHCTLGMALQTLGLSSDAVQSLDVAVRLNPHNAEAYCARGVIFEALDRLDDALRDYETAISLNPEYPEAFFNLGNVLNKLSRPKQAIASFDQAITLRPHYAEAYNNRGSALKEMNLLKPALLSYEQAILCDSVYSEAYTNKGVILKDLQLLDAAIESYDKAIELDPGSINAHWSKALTLLLKGELEDGFRYYEWRWKRGIQLFISQPINSPLWFGSESLEGKTIVLLAEQGYGDVIQFSRYVSEVARIGARVILQVPKPLLRLFQSLKEVDQCIESGTEIPAHDFHCPLMSLPLVFQTRLDSIPPPLHSLRADSIVLQYWQRKLGDKRNMRIGLVWSGSATHLNDSRRSIPWSDLKQFLPANLEYHCLQKEIRPSDVDLLPDKLHVRYWKEEITDFADTAALCELMDIVISVDTSVAHLAASLGKTTWVLLPYAPDWRWLLHRNDSPWYPTVKLYRQDETMSWYPLLEKISSDLMVDSKVLNRSH